MAQHKTITREEVMHMAQLSRLETTAEEQETFARQLGDILGYMDVLAQVETTDVEPLYSPVLHPCSLREDRCHNLRSVEQVLSNAPETDGHTFIVPRIV